MPDALAKVAQDCGGVPCPHDDVFAPFFAATGRRAELVLATMTDRFSPVELLQFVHLLQEVDHPMRETILASPVFRYLMSHPGGRAFKRVAKSEDAMFYSDGAAPEGKALLLCFGGLIGRFGVPIAVILQSLDAARFDLALLRDPKRSRFRLGAGDFATCFVDLIHNVDRVFSPWRYQRVISIGNSMGGNPAVQYAQLAGAERAVAVGARVSSDPLRLLHRQPVPCAFDPVCDCMRHRPLRGLWVYAAENAEDAEGAAALFARAGGQRLALTGFAGHNVVARYWEADKVDRLLALLLDSDLPKDRDATSAIRLMPAPEPGTSRCSLPRRIVSQLRRIVRRLLAKQG